MYVENRRLPRGIGNGINAVRDSYANRNNGSKFWVAFLFLMIMLIVAIVIGVVSLEKSHDAEAFINGGFQTITAYDGTIGDDVSNLILKRTDWVEGNYVQKCGLFELPRAGNKKGRKLTVYNAYKQCNTLVQPDYNTGEKQFWHITFRDLDQSVDLVWAGARVGWSVTNKQGHHVHVHSLKDQLDRYMYVLHTVRGLVDVPEGARDCVSTIDVRADSTEYGSIVHVALGFRNATWEEANGADRTEYHHGHLFENEGHPWIVVPSLSYTNPTIDFYDLAHDKKAPALSSYIAPWKVKSELGIGALHTVHEDLQTGNVLISFLGSTNNAFDSPGGIASFSPNLATHLTNDGDEFAQQIYLTFPVVGPDSLGNQADNYAYDYHLEQDFLNIMVTTSWGSPRSFDAAFNPGEGYGIHVNVWKLFKERSGYTKLPTDPNAELIVSFTLSPVPGMGGPPDGQGIVPLEVRRSKNPGEQYYYVGITLPGSVVLVYCDHEYGVPDDCDNAGDWHMETVISPDRLADDGVDTVHVTNQGGNAPVWTDPFGYGDFRVPLVTDITISEGNGMLYVALWLYGTVLQYDISDMKNPVLTGGVANLGGVTRIDPFVNVFNPNGYEYAPGIQYPGGPQMLKLVASGKELYITNSLFSSWDMQFYPPGAGSIELYGGALIKILTGTVNDKVYPPGTDKPMSIDTSFGTGGVISFGGLTHPEVSGPFMVRAHEVHFENSNH